MTTSSMSRPPVRRALLVVASLAVAACSGSTVTGSPAVSLAAPSGGASAPPSVAVAPASQAASASSAVPSSAPSGSGGAAMSNEPTAVATSVDPCQVIPAQEASTLAGASFGAGKEETTPGNVRICIYGGQTKNVFEVIVAIAPDVATAKKEEAAVEGQLDQQAAQAGQKLGVTKLPNFASGTDAVLLEMPANTLGIGGRAIYVLRGTTFFGFSDLVVGGAAPSADAMKAEATTVLTRVP